MWTPFLAFLGLLALTTPTSAESRPRGLFIQVSTCTTSLTPFLDRWLSTICRRNAELPATDTINDIVLVDVASENTTSPTNYTMHFNVLDIVTPFLRGGAKQCFNNVFVGTINLDWHGAGNMYKNGTQDPVWRQRNFDLSKQVLLQFKQRYPHIQPIHWYVSHEANLNFLTDSAVRDAYQSFLVGMIKVFTSISPGSVMWSPAFWSTLAEMTASEEQTLQTNLNRMFTNVAAQAPPGVNWMNMQDSVGKASNCTSLTTTRADAVALYRFLSSSFAFKSMQMNEELFVRNGNCGIYAASAETQMATEAYYAQQGVRMGAAFELRYWRERWATAV